MTAIEIIKELDKDGKLDILYAAGLVPQSVMSKKALYDYYVRRIGYHVSMGNTPREADTMARRDCEKKHRIHRNTMTAAIKLFS